MHLNLRSNRNTCWGLLLFCDWKLASQMCHCNCCKVDSNKCAVCLLPEQCPPPLHPLTLETCPTFQTCFASLPDFLLFHSSPPPRSLLGSLYVGQRWALNGVLSRLWTGPASPPPPPHRYSAHILPNVYFHCDFFSPLAPFLCLTCIPSQNLYGWLDNFTALLTPKGPPESRGLSRYCPAHSLSGSSEVLI